MALTYVPIVHHKATAGKEGARMWHPRNGQESERKEKVGRGSHGCGGVRLNPGVDSTALLSVLAVHEMCSQPDSSTSFKNQGLKGINEEGVKRSHAHRASKGTNGSRDG